MTETTPVAIIGAGPYGLSVAAHLRGANIPFRIFGSPMDNWRRHMPKGMELKSEGFASNLSDPQRQFTLDRFCAARGIAYKPVGLPIKLSTIVDYGLAFQQRYAPDLDETMVNGLTREARGFVLALEDGRRVIARTVVVATGLDAFRMMPDQLAGLPRTAASHSADHHDLAGFAGKRVAVIGAGASGIDLAALLHEAGARSYLVHRRRAININVKRPERQPLLERLRAPDNVIGPGWSTLAFAKLPHLFRHLPDATRVRIAKHFIPPAAGYSMQGRVEGRVALVLGCSLQRAELDGGEVVLHLKDADGRPRELAVDHVIAATGFRPALDRLTFIDAELRDSLARIERVPRLSAHFESSAAGLFFVGPMTLYDFGPLVRFIAGTRFTARRVASQLAAVAR